MQAGLPWRHRLQDRTDQAETGKRIVARAANKRKSQERMGGRSPGISGRDQFFATPITVFASRQSPANKVQRIRDELSQLSFHVEVVECEQSTPITLYHRGDVIFGARLKHFVEYATWLGKQQ